MNDIKTLQVSEHAKLRIRERVANIGNEKPSNLFKKVMSYGKQISEFYGDYKNYLTGIYTKNGGKLKLKIYGSNIYLYGSTVSKHILVTVLNTPEEFEPWKDYLCCNRNDVEVINRLQQKKLLKESEVVTLEKVLRKDMLKWSNEELASWREKAYEDREHSYIECKHCQRYLPCTEFSKDTNKTNRIGFRPECKECYKAITEYGGIKKMRADGVSIFDLLTIEKSIEATTNVEPAKATEPIRLKSSDVGLRDKIIRCKECDNDFIFNYGEQTYYRNHGYYDPTKCPECREKAKLEKAKEAETSNATVIEQPKSNSTVIAEQAKKLLVMLRDNHLTLEAFEQILEVYEGSNEYVLELVKTFEDLVVDNGCQCCKIGEQD